jgi:molecular chaperone GrpE
MKKAIKSSGSVVSKPRQELKEMESRYLRALADYQNLSRRHETQSAELARYAAETVLDKLIPVLENLERAQEHLNDKGLMMVIKQFHDLLESEGVSEIQTRGVEFDPESMDCVELVAGKKNQVVSTISRGWLLHDRVLRAAKVSVGKGKN